MFLTAMLVSINKRLYTVVVSIPSLNQLDFCMSASLWPHSNGVYLNNDRGVNLAPVGVSSLLAESNSRLGSDSTAGPFLGL